MKNLIKIFIFICILFTADLAHAVSLDAMYRDVVKSTHDGYLPIFVKNRETPTLDIDDTKFDTSYKIDETQYEVEKINFSNDLQMQKIAEMKANEEWLNTVEAVESRMVTPLDLERIEKRVTQNYPKAIEVYAWMFAKGVGVEKDLIKSFALYKKAEELNVEKAHENALKVYKVMTQEQKEKVLYN